MSSLSIILLTFATLAAAGGQLLLRVGAQGRAEWLEFINWPIAAGLLLYGIGTVIWIYTLSYEKLTTVYGFTALTFVLVFLGGVTLLNESLSYAAMFGILLILAGLYLIST